MRIKVGDIITAFLFGGKIVSGKIESIELCAKDEKYGTSVEQCDTKNNNGVVDLDCGNWCYFYQIKNLKQ